MTEKEIIACASQNPLVAWAAENADGVELDGDFYSCKFMSFTFGAHTFRYDWGAGVWESEQAASAVGQLAVLFLTTKNKSLRQQLKSIHDCFGYTTTDVDE